MITVHLIILVTAFVLVLLCALSINPQRVNLGWLGLALFILDFLIK
jgi:hypothetical protein